MKVYDERGNVVFEKTFTESDVNEGNYWWQTGRDTRHLRFVSEGNVSVIYADAAEHLGGAKVEDVGDDIAQIGVKPGTELRFYTSLEAVLFSLEKARVTVDDIEWDMEVDEFIKIGKGFHTAKSDKVFIIQLCMLPTAVVGTPGSWSHYGTSLVCAQDVELTLAQPKESEKQGGSQVSVEVIVGATVAVVVIVVLALRRKGLQF